MKYALFIAEEVPAVSIQDKRSWSTFVEYAKQETGANKHVSRLCAGTYLCNLDGGLNGLSDLVNQARNHGVHSRTLFFDKEPAWVISN